jgi:peptidoglycan L-alanyl-D-glutamate endopeptidase CwlK
MRTKEQQKELVACGASRTMNSRHLTGHAVDVVAWKGGKISWSWPLYHQISNAMKQAALELQVDIQWGGDWVSFKDGPHFQLTHESYPDDCD